MSRIDLDDAARRIPGWGWMVLCATCFCLMGITVRELVADRGVNVFWIGWLRFLIGASSMAIPGLLGCWSLHVHNRPVFALRGVVGSTGQFMLFVVIAYVGLGRGTVLMYLMGVVGAVSGIFILRERPTRALLAALLLSTAGVFLSCQTGVPRGAEWLALLGALCSGTTLSLIRLLRRTDSNQVVFLSQGLFGLVLLTPFVVGRPLPHGAAVWGLIGLLNLFDVSGQLCMNQGLKMLPVARGASLMMLTPVISLLAGGILLHEPLSMRQWVGCIIVLAGAFLAVRARVPGARRVPTDDAAAHTAAMSET